MTNDRRFQGLRALVCRFFGHNPEIVKKLYGFTDAHCRRCGRVGIGVLA